MSEVEPVVEGKGGGLSRRTVLGGVAAAGAALSAAGAVVLPEVAGAAVTQVAMAPNGINSVELVARIDQKGDQLVAYGFLTSVFGLSSSDLFFAQPASEGSAAFTMFAVGHLTNRAVREAVHSIDVSGELTIYHRAQGGADFSDPDSFKVGTQVARYQLEIQDILSVIAAGTGIPTLVGDVKQRQAASVGGGKGKFGKVGLTLRLFATGFGTRANTDPEPPVATLNIAGNLVVA